MQKSDKREGLDGEKHREGSRYVKNGVTSFD